MKKFRAGMGTQMHPDSLSPSPAVLGLDAESLYVPEPNAAADQPRGKAGLRKPAGHCQSRGERVMLHTAIKVDFS